MLLNHEGVKTQKILVLGALSCLFVYPTAYADNMLSKARLYSPGIWPNPVPVGTEIEVDVNVNVSGVLVKDLQSPVLVVQERDQSISMVYDEANNSLKASVMIDAREMKAGDCLTLKAVAGDVVSASEKLCVTSLPTSTAPSRLEAKLLKDSEGNEFIADEMIVRFREVLGEDDIRSVAGVYNAQVIGQIFLGDQGTLYQIRFEEPFLDFQSASNMLQKMMLDFNITEAEFNGVDSID